jgi:hypothetical protein
MDVNAAARPGSAERNAMAVDTPAARSADSTPAGGALPRGEKGSTATQEQRRRCVSDEATKKNKHASQHYS